VYTYIYIYIYIHTHTHIHIYIICIYVQREIHTHADKNLDYIGIVGEWSEHCTGGRPPGWVTFMYGMNQLLPTVLLLVPLSLVAHQRRVDQENRKVCFVCLCVRLC
jgi:hypothetical protein